MSSTNSEENYIKGILSLSAEDREWINTNDLAARMNTKPSSVTDMVQKLGQKKLVLYKKYKGVKLTAKGRELALEVVRKHRLWEVFLQEKLGFSWDEVHEIAEQLEHIISPELIDRLDRFLSFPKYDPHGDPIPDAKGNMVSGNRNLISDCKPGDRGILVGVNDSSPAFLKFLESKKLTLGTEIEIAEKHDFDHSVDVFLSGRKNKIAISREVSTNLYISVNS